MNITIDTQKKKNVEELAEAIRVKYKLSLDDTLRSDNETIATDNVLILTDYAIPRDFVVGVGEKAKEALNTVHFISKDIALRLYSVGEYINQY